MNCPYFQNGTCVIASTLAQKPVVPHETACRFCSEGADPSQEVNRVTVSLAISATAGTPLQKDLLTLYGFWLPRSQARNNQDRLKAILAGTGPGSQLWRILDSIHIKHSATCSCLTHAEQMNAWGPVGCRLARAEIVEWMKAGQKDYGWGDIAAAVIRAVTTGLAWRLSILDPFGSLVDEAIRLAELPITGHLSPITGHP